MSKHIGILTAGGDSPGLNVITLPKTIDNDVFATDVTFGFDTALGIATDVIDRLHSGAPPTATIASSW